MTSPGNPPIIPQRGYTASTIYQLQDVDPDALGRGANADMHGELEGVRGNLFNGLLGGFTSVPAALVPIINGIFNGWFGGGGVGDPLQVQYTIEAIADAVINGYNVETKVTSGTWTKPANITELVVVAIGCGKNGANGNGSSVAQGGLGGGYLAQQIDPTTVASSTPYVVGTGGNPSSFGSHVVTTPGGGGIATSFGYTTTSSTPGRGGNGGKGYSDGSGAATPGQSGEGSALAAGGAGGAASTNNTDQLGGAGSNVSAASVTKCGGGGGGGGGGGPNSLGQQRGGAGGPGGYPGGGGGGGGGRSSIIGVEPNGAGGIGATGVIWIFWR